MATSGSGSAWVDSTRHIKLVLKWQQLSQDIPANRTRIRLTLQVVTDGAGAMYGGASLPWSITCNGTTSNRWSIQTGANQTRTIGTRDVDITHNPDGSKTFSASASATFNMNFNGYVSSVNVSVSGTLNRIARASQPSIITWPNTTDDIGDIGSKVTIHMNRASTSFTHTVKYSFRDLNATIATKVADSTEWTIPTSFADKLPDADTEWGRIIVDTYNGSTLIGTKEVRFTCHVPASYKPTCTGVTVTDTSGLYAKYGAYVSGKSHITIKVAGSGSHGSTIKSYGKKYNRNAEQSNTTGSFTDDPQAVGTIPIVGSVTDSRGRRGEKSVNITVLAYNPPSLSGTSVARTPNDESSTVRVTVKGNTTNLNSKGVNTATVKIERRQQGTGSWTQVSSANKGVSWNYTQDITNLSPDLAWEIRVTATDQVGTITQTVLTVSTASPILDFKADGKGLGIGSVATRDDAAEFGWQVNANRGLGLHMVAGNENQAGWVRLASVSSTGNAHVVILTVYCGSGNNGNSFQNAWYRIFIKDGWQSTASAEDAFGVSVETCNTGTSLKVKVLATSDHECEVWAYHPWGYTTCYLSIEASVGAVVTPAAYNLSVTTEPQGVEQIVDYRRIWDGTQTNDARQRFVDHVMLDNNIAITGATTDGSQTVLLRMNTSNRVELGWTSGGLGGMVMKQLWSGTANAGAKITINNIDKYNLFACSTYDDYNMMLGVISPNRKRLVFSCNDADGSVSYFRTVRLELNGTSATVKASGWNNLTSHAWAGDPVKKIWGII